MLPARRLRAALLLAPAWLQRQLDVIQGWKPEDTDEFARQAAMLYGRCRWQGLTIRSPNDCLIAASAIEAGEPLLQADPDFDQLAAIDPRLQFALRAR